MILPFALAQLIARCAPNVGIVTMSAVVVHESAGRPNAIGDNTTHRAYDLTDRYDAMKLADRLLRRGDNLDVGYAQINSSNFAAYGLNVTTAFDPCTNISIGGHILRNDYTAATRAYGPGQAALRHALSAYNTGGYWRGLAYARDVYATAAHIYGDALRTRPVRPKTP
jgi:type IV secretion system protein VirB1